MKKGGLPPVSLMSPWVVHVPEARRKLKCTICGETFVVEMDRPKETGIEELRWIAEYNRQVETFLGAHAPCGEEKA